MSERREDYVELNSTFNRLSDKIENLTKEAITANLKSDSNEKRLDKMEDVQTSLSAIVVRHEEQLNGKSSDSSFWSSDNGKVALYIGLALVTGLVGLAGYNITLPP